jgi:chaperonin cofactor prefoldin
LKDNIILLENISENLEKSIEKLKITFDKINDNKEELKLKIQKIFTKIRNALNDREDKILYQ